MIIFLQGSLLIKGWKLFKIHLAFFFLPLNVYSQWNARKWKKSVCFFVFFISPHSIEDSHQNKLCVIWKRYVHQVSDTLPPAAVALFQTPLNQAVPTGGDKQRAKYAAIRTPREFIVVSPVCWREMGLMLTWNIVGLSTLLLDPTTKTGADLSPPVLWGLEDSSTAGEAFRRHQRIST